MEKKMLVIPEGKIADYIDGKFRNDTPEEYVRQTIEKRLVNEHKYPKERIEIEYTLRVGSKKPRADVVIFPKNNSSHLQENISIIIECKNETVDPNNKRDGVGQLQSYMAASLNCEWGMWTNGKYKIVYRKIANQTGVFEFIEYNDIPSAEGSLEDIDKPKRETLINAVEDNLLFVFRTCHNHIYVTDGLQKQPAFFEFLKVIFCKIEDERNIPNPLEFFATSSEVRNPDGQLTVKNRINKIFQRVKEKRQYRKIFDPNDEIKLQPRSLSYIVSELQKYSLLNTHIDVKGKAYEELVGANLRGDRGEFFTPRNIMHMTVGMVNPKSNEKVLDSSCGTGGFLVIAMNHVIEELKLGMEREIRKNKSDWNSNEQQRFQDRIKDIAETNFFGFDINPDLVKATKMNMVMNNDGSGNILQNDTLLPPHEWSDDFKTKLSTALGITKDSITNFESIGFFDLIITNPPFGSKIPIKDPHILEQFEIARIWQENKSTGQWNSSDKLQSSVPPEQLFIERCLQLLKPKGRMGIVLPDSILGSPGLGYIRQWLVENVYIIASIDLHADTFQPGNGTQTSVLILQKKSRSEKIEEERTGKMRPYSTFMAMIEKVGHDKRGNTLFKRDKYGNEILISENGVDTRGNNTTSKVKMIDDQTSYIPMLFRKFKEKEGIVW